MVLAGSLDVGTAHTIWEKATETVGSAKESSIELDASGLAYIDGFGAAFLLDLKRRAAQRKLPLRIVGLSPEAEAMLEPFAPEDYVAGPPVPPGDKSVIASIGLSARVLLKDLASFCEFTGEASRALVFAALHPRTVRWRDVFTTAVSAGADAIPVIMLIGFLIGFVMAFQAAIPMRQYGADVFIPTLVGLAMVRELGPIMTAIGLAGRSGAAFAAEIGTMKVNEEVSALITFGLAPVRFLIIPRILAAMLVTPFLIVFANVAGLLGGLAVFVSIGYPVQVYFDQLSGAISLTDLVGGLVKGFAFGFFVAAIGCMKGLQTTTGASAVGRSTTSAVVTSIVVVAVGDGLFAIIYYSLGI